MLRYNFDDFCKNWHIYSFNFSKRTYTPPFFLNISKVWLTRWFSGAYLPCSMKDTYNSYIFILFRTMARPTIGRGNRPNLLEALQSFNLDSNPKPPIARGITDPSVSSFSTPTVSIYFILLMILIYLWFYFKYNRTPIIQIH